MFPPFYALVSFGRSRALPYRFGKDSLSEVYTFLTRVNDAEGNVDLKQSIYIDWGAFINAVINFFVVAFVLFCIVKIVNKFREENKEAREKLKKA